MKAFPSKWHVYFCDLELSDFELKDAYIEGAKAGHTGLALNENPYSTFEKQAIWANGHQTATDGHCSLRFPGPH
jgi:hypothetical protein